MRDLLEHQSDADYTTDNETSVEWEALDDFDADELGLDPEEP